MTTNPLAKLSDATRMLAEVRDAQDAKKMMDLASAAEHYAKKARLGEESIQYAHEIKTDAEALLGEFLSAADDTRGGDHTSKDWQSKSSREEPLLADLGLSKKESSEAQLLARLKASDPEKFEAVRTRQKSKSEVRREVRRAAVLEKVQLPSGKFRVLLCDPPWKYGDGLTEDYGPTGYHYPSMSISELCDMPVIDLVEDDAVLFLWVTSPLLFECEPIISAWGFQYKTSFVWDKMKHNMGHYNSVRHEFLLICTRGSCVPDVSTLIDSVQSIERTGHSEKPEEFRKIIETLYPHGRRLELFARKQTEGWEVYGNAVAL